MQRKKILLLDDCDELLELTSILLDQLGGYDTLRARSYQDVIDLGASAIGCSMAILDINLGPNQPTGVDVYTWLRAKGFARPIMFLTGHASTYPPVAAAVLLKDAIVMTKPVPSETLLETIRELNA